MALCLGHSFSAQLLSGFLEPTRQGRGPTEWELTVQKKFCYLVSARIRRAACVPEPHWLGPRKPDIFEGFVRSVSDFCIRLFVVANQRGWGTVNRDGL